jgi:glucose/arabinose dehydrogenase
MAGLLLYGIDYDNTISNRTTKKGIQDPEYYWAPSIAPSGMAFVTSTIYPNWKGNLLVGSLKFQYVEMLTFTGDKITETKKLPLDVGRLRNIMQGLTVIFT